MKLGTMAAIALLAALAAACGHKPPKPAPTHIRADEPRAQGDIPLARAGFPDPAQAQTGGAPRDLQRRSQQRTDPGAAFRARTRCASQRRHPSGRLGHRDAQRDRPDAAAAAHAHRAPSRHALRDPRRHPHRDARLALPAHLQGGLPEREPEREDAVDRLDAVRHLGRDDRCRCHERHLDYRRHLADRRVRREQAVGVGGAERERHPARDRQDHSGRHADRAIGAAASATRGARRPGRRAAARP